MELFAFDIETDTSDGGGLDPRTSPIVSLAVWSPQHQVVIDGGSEADRIRRFLAVLDELSPAVAVTWNGQMFDIPYIADRAASAGIDTGFALVADRSIVAKYPPLPGHGGGYRARLRHHRHVDVAGAYRSYALGRRELGRDGWALKPVCRSLGIDMVEVDRRAIHLLAAEQNRAYNLSDARGTYLLGERLGARLEALIDQVPDMNPGA